MKHVFILVVATLFISTKISAQKNNLVEVKITTSAVCDMCKERIENGLFTQKGIVEANLDVATKIVTIKFRSNKTSVEVLRKYISSIGYSADEIVADKTAYDKLPGCCQLGGMH